MVKRTRDYGEIVGDNIRRLRGAWRPKKLSQIQLGELSGIARATIAALEGHRYPSVDMSTVGRLAEALGVSIFELLSDFHEGPLEAAITQYLHSPWCPDQKTTPEEIAWLRRLPRSQWMGARMDARSIAGLIEWRRNNPDPPPDKRP